RFTRRPGAAVCRGCLELAGSHAAARRGENPWQARLTAGRADPERSSRGASRSEQSQRLLGAFTGAQKLGAILDALDRLRVHLEGPEGRQRVREFCPSRFAVASGRIHSSEPPQCDRPISLVLRVLADFQRTPEPVARCPRVAGVERELAEIALALDFELLMPEAA